MARQKQWQALNSLVLLGGLVWLFGIMLTVCGGLLSSPMPFDDPDFWWGLGFSLVAYASYFVLFQQITTAQLTFESDNRSSGIRITGSVQFLLLWLCFIGYCWVTGSSMGHDEVIVIAVLSAIHWSVVGLFVTTEDNYLSRRVRRGLPKNASLRLLFAPFMPGGSRGYVYVVLHLAIGILFFFVLTSVASMLSVSYSGSRSWGSLLMFVTCLSGYVAAYLGIGTALGRWGRLVSSELRPAHVRVTTLLIFVAGLILPYLPGAMDLVRWSNYTLFYVTNPIESIWEVERNRGYAEIITLLVGAGALIAIGVNSVAMLRSVTEIVSAGPKPSRLPQFASAKSPETVEQRARRS